MTNGVALRDNQLIPGGIKAALRAHGWNCKSTGACIGLIGGVIAPLVGAAFTALGWLIGDWHGIHLGRDGTVLLFLTIPLLIFGAHCLDLMDKDHEGAGRRSSRRQDIRE